MADTTHSLPDLRQTRSRGRALSRGPVLQSWRGPARLPHRAEVDAQPQNWPVAPLDRIDPGPPPPARVEGAALRATFVNHSTVLLQTGGVNILTDPVWSRRVSPVQFAGPKRHRAPGIRFEDLPPIHCLLISHNHYDHFDSPRSSASRPRIGRLFLPARTPACYGAWALTMSTNSTGGNRNPATASRSIASRRSTFRPDTMRSQPHAMVRMVPRRLRTATLLRRRYRLL